MCVQDGTGIGYVIEVFDGTGVYDVLKVWIRVLILSKPIECLKV